MDDSNGQAPTTPAENQGNKSKAHKGLYFYTNEPVDPYLERIMQKQEQLRQQKQVSAGLYRWKIHPRKMRDGGEFLNDLANQVRVLVQDEPDSFLIIRFSDSKAHYYGQIAACMDQLVELSGHCPFGTTWRILVIFPHHNTAWPNLERANNYYQYDVLYHKIMKKHGIAVTLGGLVNFTNSTMKDTIRFERQLHNDLIRDIDQRIWPGFVSKQGFKDNNGNITVVGYSKTVHLGNVDLGQGEANGVPGKRRIDSAEGKAHGEGQAKKPAPEDEARKTKSGKKGVCSKCSQRGHYFRNCPARKPKAPAAKGEEAPPPEPEGSEAMGENLENCDMGKSGEAGGDPPCNPLDDPEQMEEGDESPTTKMAIPAGQCKECLGVHAADFCGRAVLTETILSVSPDMPVEATKLGETKGVSYQDPPIRGVIALEAITDSEGDEPPGLGFATGLGDLGYGNSDPDPPPTVVDYEDSSSEMTQR